MLWTPNILYFDNFRIYLLFDGIHYDVLVKNICEDMDQETDIGVSLSSD